VNRGFHATLFDILQDGIVFLDDQDRIEQVNASAARLLGQKAAALLGQRLPEVARQEALADLTRQVRTKKRKASAEYYLPSLAGLGQVAGLPLPADEDRAPGGVLLVLRDVSHLHHLETAGEEYATNVSHELKTPLTLILGYTETLLANPDLDVEFRNRCLRTLERHAKRIIRIVDDLMRLSWLRNEAASTGIPRTRVKVASVINRAVHFCREWAANAGIEIETDVPADLAWHLNSGLVEEALINLIKNALLYALKGPIEIRAQETPSGTLDIRVADHGQGLGPEDAKHIFDRFYRVDKSRARATGGSGLGLPIVQQIVEAHHGSARVESEPGGGCTFILEIPPKSTGG